MFRFIYYYKEYYSRYPHIGGVSVEHHRGNRRLKASDLKSARIEARELARILEKKWQNGPQSRFTIAAVLKNGKPMVSIIADI